MSVRKTKAVSYLVGKVIKDGESTMAQLTIIDIRRWKEDLKKASKHYGCKIKFENTKK